MTHEPRLTIALRTLLQTQRVAALGTLNADGSPFVSMVPFAVEPASVQLVIHVSGLAGHTRNLQTTSHVSLLVMQAGLNMGRAEIADYVRGIVDVFVQLSRRDGRRAVSQITFRGD